MRHPLLSSLVISFRDFAADIYPGINDTQTRERLIDVLVEDACYLVDPCVKCDEENNPPDLVDQNKLLADVFFTLEGRRQVLELTVLPGKYFGHINISYTVGDV